MREPSMRVLARALNGSSVQYQQAGIEDPLEETTGNDNAQPAGSEPLSKARKPARKRSTAVKKASIASSQSKASRAAAATSVLPGEQQTASLESDVQPRKRKVSVGDEDQPPLKKAGTEGQGDQEQDSSDLSELGAMPDPPSPDEGQSLDPLPTVEDDDVEVDALPSNDFTSDASNPPPVTDQPDLNATEEESADFSPTGSVAALGTSVPDTVPGERLMVCLKLSSPVSQIPPAPDSSLGPAATLPTPTSACQTSCRQVKRPVRFGELVDTPAEATEGDSAIIENDIELAGDSPTARKAARKMKAKPKAKPKAPVSPEKVTEDDLADDVPAATKAPRKRKAATTQSTPRKKPSTPKTKAKVTKARKPAATPSVPSAAKSKALLSLPSPVSSPSQSDLAASEFSIDAGLLKLSRAMTHREPLESKLDPAEKPEVWAPGRLELCETLPYFKSAHSGCYANDGTVFAFMFDSTGVIREYMDSDVVIARMGGQMAADDKARPMLQTGDHLMTDKQPQSLLNNIAHRNPLVIVCGNKNQGALTRMPHRYCVLDWFKPTHVWGEKTMGKKGPLTTIRYRFERLDRSKESWYRPTPSAGSTAASGSSAGSDSLAPSGEPTEPMPAEPEIFTEPELSTDLTLLVQTCSACAKSCPQVYLIDWICTNPGCTGFWKLSNGQDAPYGELDYHPAFLQHRTEWEREDPPYSLNPGLPQIDRHFGDNLTYVNTRGVVCPDCGRCTPRYLFTHWQCDCGWKLNPQVQVVMPSNLGHTPWDMPSDGPSLAKAVVKPAIRTQVKYYSNYKVVKYTIEGVIGSVIVAKANKLVTSEPGGADDMFREMQTANVGLERRVLRKTADAEPRLPSRKQATAELDGDQDVAADDGDDDDAEHEAAGVGIRMNAFGMNFGMPYKFIASGDSRSFEEAPQAVRSARSRLNWAQRVFINDEAGYQDFNEELIFAYMQGQKIKFHDDGEKGLGLRIATLSLGAAATMTLRVKAKYYSQVSKGGIFTDEKPLPLPLLESCGYASGYIRKAKGAALQSKVPESTDTHVNRLAAWDELQALREKVDTAAFRIRSKELATELNLHQSNAEPILSFHLTHGDIVFMEGEDIQKFLEHAVEPHGHLRFAMTCRTVLPGHLPPDELPPYEVLPDSEGYDGAGIREERDGNAEAVVWE